MGIDRTPTAPARDNQIDALPEWNLAIAGAGDVIERAHPKRSQRFVIKIGDAVMRGEETNLLAHPLQRLVR